VACMGKNRNKGVVLVQKNLKERNHMYGLTACTKLLNCVLKKCVGRAQTGLI
jgi:hypothetical protein